MCFEEIDQVLGAITTKTKCFMLTMLSNINNVAIIFPSTLLSIFTAQIHLSLRPQCIMSLSFFYLPFLIQWPLFVGSWSPRGRGLSRLLFRQRIYSHNNVALVEAQVVAVKNSSHEGSVVQHNQIFMSSFSFFFSPSAGICPKPIKNRDVVTLRSWQVMDDEYIIVNFSVKHPVRRRRLLHTLPDT